MSDHKPQGSIHKKQRKRKPPSTTVANVFAYPNDDTGLPLPVAGFPPVPEVLLDYTRRDMKQSLVHKGLSSAETVDNIVSWAVSNPFCPAAHNFRQSLK